MGISPVSSLKPTASIVRLVQAAQLRWESRLSTGCRRKNQLRAGWRGRPAQVGISSRQLVVVKIQFDCRLARPPSSGGISPGQLVVPRGTDASGLNRPPSSGGNLARSTGCPPKETSSVQVGEAAQLRWESRPVNWLSPEGQLRAGWRGRPAQAESRPSTGCRKEISSVRLDEAAQLRRNLVPSTGYPPRASPCQAGEAAQLRTESSPVNWLPGSEQDFEVGQVTQLDRNLPGQLV